MAQSKPTYWYEPVTTDSIFQQSYRAIQEVRDNVNIPPEEKVRMYRILEDPETEKQFYDCLAEYFDIANYPKT